VLYQFFTGIAQFKKGNKLIEAFSEKTALIFVALKQKGLSPPLLQCLRRYGI
jgi:hypothetical protein